MIYGGTMEEYIGILIAQYDNGLFGMLQPHLIERIISSVHSMIDIKSATTPASVGIVLANDVDGEVYKEHWNYKSVIGMLKYLVRYTLVVFSYTVNQCAKFHNDP